MDFKGTGTRLSDTDLPRIGSQIGVGEDVIHAVLDVECRGAGWQKDGKLKMLFEPHVFYRELPRELRSQAIRARVACRNWGDLSYPKDSYARLEEARGIHGDAALRSASWGLPQMMGFNHRLAGYDSALEMIENFKLGEAYQLQGMVNFIQNSNLDDELRVVEAKGWNATAEDWAPFAMGYNGSSFRKHGYHTRLFKAHRRWLGIPDTPWTPENTDKPIDPASTLPDHVQDGFLAALVAFFEALSKERKP